MLVVLTERVQSVISLCMFFFILFITEGVVLNSPYYNGRTLDEMNLFTKRKDLLLI